MPAGYSMGMEFLPNTTDWYGRWRLAQNQSNDYQIDREVQRTRSFTGIEGIHVQDQAITESMGEIVDHSHEHLGHSDMMVIQTRRRLIEAAIDLKERGIVPPGVDDPEIYLQVHAGDFLIAEEKDFLEAYGTQPRTSVDLEGRIHPPTMSNAEEISAAAK
jgi:phthalate 4,5-dioxygenase